MRVHDLPETTKRLFVVVELGAHQREVLPELVGLEAALDRPMKVRIALFR
jgi:hypothetical protein